MGFVDRPQSVWWRKLMFQVHLWIGILLALYVIAISVSGCVLIFGREITDDAPSVALREGVPRVELERFAVEVKKLHPDYDLNGFQNLAAEGKALRVTLEKETGDPKHKTTQRRVVYFDPYDGRMIADRDDDFKKIHPVYAWLQDLHINLLAGRTGLKVNAACGGGLLLLCITGIILWWPGFRTWKQALWVRWKSGWKRINFDSHRAIGFWALAMISMWALTGLYFGYPQPVRKALKMVLPFDKGHKQPKTQWKPGDPVLPISDLYHRAQATLPTEQISAMYLPDDPGDSVFFAIIPSRTPRYLHYEALMLHPATGDVVHLHDGWKDARAGDISLSVMFMLHFASVESLFLRSIIAVFGITPAILTITGILMYWNRSLSKKWKRLKGADKRDRRKKPVISGATLEVPQYTKRMWSGSGRRG